ncbi:hypothetical protein [Leptolyngbya sp. CCY15150]|uniref:hypothetical protein n=1 Tax=Leptolyngbya sp. CCY15150 TaxID=2767772 RepID=UPI001951BBB4|nr:hypothetical protein [Leptolyngbya sp. CCY15150]
MVTKLVRSMLLVAALSIGAIAVNLAPVQAMTVSELAEYARNRRYSESDPVIFREQSAAGCPAGYTLVSAWRLQGTTLAGIVQYSQCAVMRFTYFEMDGTNRDSIRAFSEVGAGRSTQFSNWGPSPDPGALYDWELLQIVGDAIIEYAQ